MERSPAACTRDCASARPAACCSMPIASSRNIDRSLSISASAWPRLPSASGAASRACVFGVVVIARQHRGDLGRRQPAEAQPHAARADRRQQHAGHRTGQDEHRPWRRLLERLQQRILCRRFELSASRIITTRRRPSKGRNPCARAHRG